MTYDNDVVLDESTTRAAPSRSALAAALFFTLVLAIVAAAALTVLLLTRDPAAEEEQLFAGLTLCLGSALAMAGVLAFGRRTGSAVFDVLRAFRRGLLVGLACAGSAALQFNGAFSPANLAFLLLVLLIVEMIFLARRQNAS
jgi:drug/metabolite transporter (DMT)-like permease